MTDSRPDGPLDDLPPTAAGGVGDDAGTAAASDVGDTAAIDAGSADPLAATAAVEPGAAEPAAAEPSAAAPNAAEPSAPLPYAPPHRAGSAGPLGVLGALVLLAAGALLIHDALVLLNVVSGSDWITTAANWIGTLHPDSVTFWVGVALAAAGLVLIVAALFPRRAYGMRLVGDGGLYVRERDVARLASSAAQGTGVVREATSTASKRRVVVHARTTIDRDATDVATEAVVERLAIMRNPPTVVIRAKGPRS